MLPKRKHFIAGAGFAVVVIATGAGLFQLERRPEISPVLLGEQLAVQNGCFACHGRTGDENRVNFRQVRSGAWRDRSIPTFWENGIDDTDLLVEWIRDGCPADEVERHQQLFMQMPAYGGHLKPDEIEAIAAWILAEGLRLTEGMGNAARPAVEIGVAEAHALNPDQLFVLGDRLSRRHACYQCHGELGQGGVKNPASFKGHIPGFFGSEFLDLTDGGEPAEVLHWIDHGRGNKIESGLKGFFAKGYFDGQVVAMPAYAERLSDGEKAVLVNFLLLLNEKGPLSAREVEKISDLLTDGASNPQTDNSND